MSLVFVVVIHIKVLTKTPAPEVTKEPTRALPSSASSTSSRTSMEEGGSESGSPTSLSTKQLVFIAADIQKLQEQVHKKYNKCAYLPCMSASECPITKICYVVDIFKTCVQSFSLSVMCVMSLF